MKNDLTHGEISPEAVEILARTPERRRRWLIPTAIAVAVVLALGAWLVYFWGNWKRVGELEPRGGLYFVRRVELAVPSFRQGDPRWRADLLGPTPATLGAEGC